MPYWERLIYRYILIPRTTRALRAVARDAAWMGSRARGRSGAGG